MILKRMVAAAVLAASMSAGAANAATISWATWSNVVTGATAGSATGATSAGSFTYSGELQNFFANYPSYTPTSTWAGGFVGNAPPQANGIIQLFGGGANVNTIAFSAPVLNPVIAIWSLGQGGINASFNFNLPFTIEAGGPSFEYSGSSITQTLNNAFGSEGNGSIRFSGLVSQITFTNPTFENWYGFTVGVAGAVPEPSTWAMMILGLLGLGFLARRSRARKLTPVTVAA